MQVEKRRKSRTSDGQHRDAHLTLRIAVEAKQALDEAAANAGTSRSKLCRGNHHESIEHP
jgi:hypothetical protein